MKELLLIAIAVLLIEVVLIPRIKFGRDRHGNKVKRVLILWYGVKRRRSFKINL